MLALASCRSSRHHATVKHRRLGKLHFRVKPPTSKWMNKKQIVVFADDRDDLGPGTLANRAE